jgi:hypothetical protein
MTLNVGSTGALMVMIVIALWLWRRGERPIRSGALSAALILMIAGISVESFYPFLTLTVTKWADGRSGEGCWMFVVTALNVAVHAAALGFFVAFILKTIASKYEAETKS